MSILDILITLIGVCFVLIYYRRGAVTGLSVILGLFLGLFIGSRISQDLITSHNPSFFLKIVQVALLIVPATIFLLLSGIFGRRITVRMYGKKIFKVDQYAGVAVGVLVAIFVVCLSGSILVNNPSVDVQNVILSSKILSYIDDQSVLGLKIVNLATFIDPGYNSVFNGEANNSLNGRPTASTASYDLPTSGDFSGVVNKEYNSVVFVNWTGCGGRYFGSGYVVAPHYVVTAAHVIAGAGLVHIDNQSDSYIGYVVLDDTSKDTAVIYVPSLSGDPALTVNPNIQPVSTKTAILGFKLGGPLQIGLGSIVAYQKYSETGLSLSGEVNIGRNTNFYQTDDPVNHGDSGGPLIVADGSVIGHTSFLAEDGTNDDSTQSYFVAATDYMKEVKNLENKQTKTRVATGNCLTFYP